MYAGPCVWGVPEVLLVGRGIVERIERGGYKH